MEKPRQTPPTLRFRLRTVTVQSMAEASPTFRVTAPEHIIPLVAAIYADLDQNKEHMVAFALNTRGKVTGWHHVGTGTLNSMMATGREVYGAMLRLDAAAVILVHNHPSNEADPSDEDVELTKSLLAAGLLLGVMLMDHLVIGNVTAGKLPEWKSIRQMVSGAW
jgi:DNA repair protein RadC